MPRTYTSLISLKSLKTVCLVVALKKQWRKEFPEHDRLSNGEITDKRGRTKGETSQSFETRELYMKNILLGVFDLASSEGPRREGQSIKTVSQKIKK